MTRTKIIITKEKNKENHPTKLQQSNVNLNYSDVKITRNVLCISKTYSFPNTRVKCGGKPATRDSSKTTDIKEAPAIRTKIQ